MRSAAAFFGPTVNPRTVATRSGLSEWRRLSPQYALLAFEPGTTQELDLAHGRRTTPPAWARHACHATAVVLVSSLRTSRVVLWREARFDSAEAVSRSRSGVL